MRSVDGDGSEAGGDEGAMEADTDKPKFSKKYLERLSQAWKHRHNRRRKKRLARTRKDKW